MKNNRAPTILLINPWIYDFAAFDLYMKPLGLLYLSSHLKNFGCNIHFLDCMNRFDDYFFTKGKIKNKKYGTGKFFAETIEKPKILNFYPRKYKRYGIPYNEVKKKLENLRRYNIDAVLITSMMTYWYKGVFDMIKLVSEILPDTPIFLGGIYATLMPEHAVKYSNADVVITGNNIYTIIQYIFDKLNYTDYDKTKLPDNFSKWLFPDYDLYNTLSYIVVMTSISCPFQCTYCGSRILYPHYITANTNFLFNKITHYLNHFNINNIAFYDDALLFNFNNNLKPLLDKFIKNNIKVNFHTPNGLHIKFINEEVSEYLYASNFKTIRLSLETSDEDRQKSTGGKTSNDDFIRAINYLHKAGFSSTDIEVYILFGLPEQSLEENYKSIEFVKNIGATPKIVEYSLIPQTKDYKNFFTGENIDPLLHNNSLFYIKFSTQKYKDLLDLRREISI